MASPRLSHDFRRLWVGQAISYLGSEITLFVLPYIAVRLLRASAYDVGILNAFQTLPAAIVSLPAGLWIDRLRKRPVLMTADIARGICLLSIPLLFAILHSITLMELSMVAFAVGAFTTVFDVAYQAYVPTLVNLSDLVAGNSRLQLSKSIAQTIGPTVAGWVVQVVAPPYALIADSISYVISAHSIRKIRAEEPSVPAMPKHAQGVLFGLKYIVNHRLLLFLVVSTATFNFFSGSIIRVLWMPFALRVLHLPSWEIGIVLSVGSLGALAGASMARRLSDYLGIGHTILIGAMFSGGGSWIIALANGGNLKAPIIAATGMLVDGFGALIYSINYITLRQALVPNDLQGRVGASTRFLIWGLLPLGSILGGDLGSSIGLRPALEIGATGASSACLWLALSPIRNLVALPIRNPTD